MKKSLPVRIIYLFWVSHPCYSSGETGGLKSQVEKSQVGVINADLTLNVSSFWRINRTFLFLSFG